MGKPSKNPWGRLSKGTKTVIVVVLTFFIFMVFVTAIVIPLGEYVSRWISFVSLVCERCVCSCVCVCVCVCCKYLRMRVLYYVVHMRLSCC
jgi:hypothetical protein